VEGYRRPSLYPSLSTSYKELSVIQEVDAEVCMKVFASLVDGRSLLHDACLKVDSP